MIKNQDIICISSIDWDFIWQGHQEIMSSFARNGNRVLFIENTGVRSPRLSDFPRIRSRIKNWFSGVSGIRKHSQNLHIFSPVVLPFPYWPPAMWINRRIIMSVLKKWAKVMDFNDPVIWAFLPTPLTNNIINGLNHKIVIYYCIDNFRASSGSAKKIKAPEIKLLRKADLVFVTSKELYDYCRTYNDKVFFFPFAVNFKEFERVRLGKNPVPDELRGIKRPVIGYIGGIHKWLDQDLIREAAEKYKDCSFVFVGPLQANISKLSGLKNIYFFGKRGHGKIPYLIKNFDACIIPYLITDYTRNVYPTKLNEYHAMGKPVVSTELPEIVKFNKENDSPVMVGGSYGEFISRIAAALHESDRALIEKRISSAQKNSWEARVEGMISLIESAIEEKSVRALDWRENFLKLYNASRKKVFCFVFLVLAAYFLLFYTPLVWFLAAPLKITDKPQKADTIVVFAGGVGESGKPGQGHEERVQAAISLYKQGYAKNIVFSSGYMHIYKEPLVMKALAVSLGVPEKAIILEDSAGNTYENVKFSKEILDTQGWKKIILVSSPYHMRRVALVFDKIARDIEVSYVPIGSLFYSQDNNGGRAGAGWKKISPQQLRAIIHEYLGILYYKWKGYI